MQPALTGFFHSNGGIALGLEPIGFGAGGDAFAPAQKPKFTGKKVGLVCRRESLELAFDREEGLSDPWYRNAISGVSLATGGCRNGSQSFSPIAPARWIGSWQKTTALIGTLRRLASTLDSFTFGKIIKGKIMKAPMILPPMILQESSASDSREIPIKARHLRE